MQIPIENNKLTRMNGKYKFNTWYGMGIIPVNAIFTENKKRYFTIITTKINLQKQQLTHKFGNAASVSRSKK